MELLSPHIGCSGGNSRSAGFPRSDDGDAQRKDGNVAGWSYIAKPNPNSDPSNSHWPAHESIHGHGCRSKSKSTGYPWISM
jgi:hypothetical protein